jgi:5-formyltetrahydrofolate cyclo-ligase
LISEIRSLEELKEGCFGILEPDKRFWRIISPETIDIAIVPGIVFDVEGFRVGFGKGFYDRLLPNLRKDALFIGLGYKFQVIKSFPHDINDIPLHLIITEEGILFP